MEAFIFLTELNCFYIMNTKIRENLRIGFYEQVIVGHKLSLIYLVPTMPFWSAQHSLEDPDNLQMGFKILGCNTQ